MDDLNIVILAAGEGKRMLSDRPKVMHEIMGKPMISYVVDLAKKKSQEHVIVVTGSGREEIERYLSGYKVEFAFQREQKGTAHALLSSTTMLKRGDVLVLYGDVPLLTESTLNDFLDFYRKNRAILFLITTVEKPEGYGRVIRRGAEIIRIVEEVEATEEEKKIKEINTGICIIPEEHLPLLRVIDNRNRKGEYYLTDICNIARNRGITVLAFDHPDAKEVLGINNKKELLVAQTIMRDRILERHMENGVVMLDNNIYIEASVSIGRDTTVFPNTYILGDSSIGDHVVVGPNTMIRNTKIGNHVRIEGFSVIEGAEIAQDVTIGPFSRIRPKTILQDGVKIGNFVEVKNSLLKRNTKANHLSYIGDAEIGSDVNIGAGTITCNYDGKRKHKTVIGDSVFVGSNTELVAPVVIGRGAIIGAGSTITKDVPEDALAVSRSPQRHIEGYGQKKRGKG
ncbi:MAG: bifunctional UDP-N-acetylglucosamine diphosphorylase/glucosamine-1-phosphate N-acetyltransferase GlmU [Syntrophorhabdaceae bacterium]|nr:bifunctional UDP-N-acetylglucosamine diphosphorylase/glucosamine-1-phosphate N-acetyltransferase GlmU [Syntrophorhabdaceae bacterium]